MEPCGPCSLDREAEQYCNFRSRSDGWLLNYKAKAGYTQNCNVDRSTAPWVDSGKCSLAFALIYALYVSRIILSSMESAKRDLLQGILDMLILKALALDSMHGPGFRRIGQITKGTFEVKPGLLFPALQRIEEGGWLISTWGASENIARPSITN